MADNMDDLCEKNGSGKWSMIIGNNQKSYRISQVPGYRAVILNRIDFQVKD